MATDKPSALSTRWSASILATDQNPAVTIEMELTVNATQSQRAMKTIIFPARPTVLENVFGIFELAEKILLECRIKDVLINCQRVSKQWESIITSSKRLQQALFFEPLPGYRICHFDRDERGGNHPDKLNAYFADERQATRTSDFFSVPRPSQYRYENEVTDEQRHRWNNNERTLAFANPFLDAVYHKDQNYYAPAAYVADAAADYEERRAKMCDVKPSWWRMFASQPPVYEIFFPNIDENDPDEIERYDDDGIKIFDTICTDVGYQVSPKSFEHMAPVTYAKDVVRINYRKGDYEFEQCKLDLW